MGGSGGGAVVQLGESEERVGPFVIAPIHSGLYLGTTSAAHPVRISRIPLRASG